MKYADLLFSDHDYAYMRFNVHLIPHTENILEKFPELAALEEFNEPLIDNFGESLKLDRNKVIRYICNAYDPLTPISKKYPDWIDRKKAAAILSGFDFDPVSGIFTDADPILKCKIFTINKMIITFCRIFRNVTYSMIVASYDTFYTIMEDIYDPDIKSESTTKTALDISKSRKSLLDEANKLRLEIEKYIAELLSNDNSPNSPALRADLYSMIDSKMKHIRMITPERQVFLKNKVTSDEQLALIRDNIIGK